MGFVCGILMVILYDLCLYRSSFLGDVGNFIIIINCNCSGFCNLTYLNYTV
jgi:hypothetical protein